MDPVGTIVCFLCKAFVSYRDNESSKFVRHMNSQHNAYFGMEYLLAGCSKNIQDDPDTKDDVTDGIHDESDNDQTTLEEEDAMEGEEPIMFPCSYCPKSFKKADNLEEYIQRRHGSKHKKANAKIRQLLGDMVKKVNIPKDGKIK